jgi:hypothetical protein
MGEMRNAYKMLVVKLEGKTRSEKLGVDGRIILEDLKEIGWKGVDWNESGSEKGPVAGCCVDGNEPSDCIKGKEFLN